MKISSRTLAVVLGSLVLLASPALAQTSAPAAKSDSMAPASDKKMQKPRTAESLECSKEADAKGLHGKERQKFRAECKKAAMGKK